MSSARIFNGIPRIFLIVSAGTAVALAAAVPGTTAAARAPSAGHHPHLAAAAHRARASVTAGRPLRASLAIRISPAAARPARYTLTAYRDRAGAHARDGHRARSAARGGDGYRGPRQIARRLLSRFGWAGWQFRYLDRLWDSESSWNPQAANPYSGAYGIPQAVPGSKMAAAGPDWRWSARTQIRWGMSYIADRYGSPYGAWQHEAACGWY